MESIAVSLVSHTNVGKTTLARTLMRRDVGTVFDQAHVTEVSESWPLIETDDARLLLWDTPGFGDTIRLLRRLRNEGNPVGWFLHQVWDRIGDRALWCSQEAVRNIRQDADVVVYLVSAAEDPRDAGYVEPELELLGWLDKPVLMLLNQTGSVEDAALLEAAWREASASHTHVGGVLSLDAFTRCWVQEGTLLERLGALLPDAKASAMKELVAAWNTRNLDVYRTSVAHLAGHLLETAADREALPSVLASKADKKRAMEALAGRLERRGRDLMEVLIAGHGLDGEAAAEVREKIDDFVVPGSVPVGVKGGALIGGLVTGAATGVTAEVLAGGLGFGSGVVVGAVLGAMGGAGLAKGYELVLGATREPAIRWGGAFLGHLARGTLLHYLAVAQFGRGRGAFHDDVLDGDAVGPWARAVDEALATRSADLTGLWKAAGGRDPPPHLADRITEVLDAVLRDVLAARYPESARLLEDDTASR